MGDHETMPANIEIKARLRDPERVRLLAEKLSDAPPETIEQHDTFFACPHGRLKLRQFSPDAGELIFVKSIQRAPCFFFSLAVQP